MYPPAVKAQGHALEASPAERAVLDVRSRLEETARALKREIAPAPVSFICSSSYIDSVSSLLHTFNREQCCHAAKFTIAQLMPIVVEWKPRSSSSTAPDVMYGGGLYDSRLRAPWFGPVGVRCSSTFADNPQHAIHGPDAQPTETSSTAGQHFPDCYSSQMRRSRASRTCSTAVSGAHSS